MPYLRAPNGLLIEGTAEWTPGTALLSDVTRQSDGTLDYDYEGETKMFWDGQITERNRHGETIFVDSDGNEWPESALHLVELVQRGDREVPRCLPEERARMRRNRKYRNGMPESECKEWDMKVTPREHAAILAGLRLFQAWKAADVAITARRDPAQLNMLDSIAERDGEQISVKEIDALCQRINKG